MAHLPSFHAMDLLRDTEYSSQLNAEQLYDLVLEATQDEAAAQKAGSNRAMSRLRQELTP